VAIGPDEVVDGRPCTDTGLYAADRGLLAYMLQDVRALARLWADGSTDVVAYEPIIWWVHGLKRRLVPCDLDRLVDGSNRWGCGFAAPLTMAKRKAPRWAGTDDSGGRPWRPISASRPTERAVSTPAMPAGVIESSACRTWSSTACSESGSPARPFFRFRPKTPIAPPPDRRAA